MHTLVVFGTAAIVLAVGTQLTGSPEPTEESTPQVLPAPVPEAPAERLASFWWGDFNGDGLADAYVRAYDGTGLLLRNLGNGGFADVTAGAGLEEVRAPTLAAWGDFDRDGALDLFLGTAAGPAHLMRNVGEGVFEVAHAGIEHVGWDLHAAWIDYDSDGNPDLHVRTKARDLLYHNLGGGRFEPVDLGLPAAVLLSSSFDTALEAEEVAPDRPAETPGRPAPAGARVPGATAPPSPSDIGRSPAGGSIGAGMGRGTSFSATPAGPHGATSGRVLCLDSITDQANPLDCINASSAPVLGMLYPLGPEFNIDPTGNVGIGTTTPNARLMVMQDPATGRAIVGLNTQSGGIGILGNSTAAAGGFGVKGEATATTGTGVLGDAIATSGESYGVHGRSSSTEGTGVYGENSVAGIGVQGSSLNGTGVLGEATGSSGFPTGVHGKVTYSSDNAVGVLGEHLGETTGATAIKGRQYSATGRGYGGRFEGGYAGLEGTATTTGTGSRFGGRFDASGGDGDNVGVRATGSDIGVEGISAATDGTGVYGEHTATTSTAPGVHGVTMSMDTDAAGVLGEGPASGTGHCYGVHGRSGGGPGVYGEYLGASDVAGVRGWSATTPEYGMGGQFDGGWMGLTATAWLTGPGNRYGGRFHAEGGTGVNVGVWATGTSTGVEGIGSGGTGTGVYGEADKTGVWGSATHAAGTGVLGEVSGSGYSTTAAVHGIMHSSTFLPYAAGVRGEFLGTSGGGRGVQGLSTVAGCGGDFRGGTGVLGWASETGTGVRYGGYFGGFGGDDGSNYGVYSSGSDFGVVGEVEATDYADVAIRGENTGTIATDAMGVVGISEPAPYYGIGGEFRGGYIGVRGYANVSGSNSRTAGYFTAGGGDGSIYGVWAIADDPQNDGEARGVYASVSTSDGYAGYFSGDASVTGTLSKGGGSFKIDHPVDPENKYLYHSFVESPDMMNVYNGNAVLDANGEVWIELPEWFETLNRDFRYQLTCIGGFAPVYVAAEVSGNRFQIAGGELGGKVSWQVTGIRQDPFAEANRVPVEEMKRPEERGLFLHPEARGLARENGIDYTLHEAPRLEKEQASVTRSTVRPKPPGSLERAPRTSRTPRREGEKGKDVKPGPPDAPKPAHENTGRGSRRPVIPEESKGAPPSRLDR